MEHLAQRAARFPKWTQTPIPHFDISAAGLLALADLSTVAQRTRISGGASWLDALLLAPGLHYQQAADAVLDQNASPCNAVELVDGKTSTYDIVNTATVQYLERVGKPGQRVVVDVGKMPQRNYFSPARNRKRNSTGQRAVIWKDQEAGLGWLSQCLYLASPVFTIAAFVFMVLLREWWGVATLLALMFSRLLNIWVIKQRTKDPKMPQPKPGPSIPGPNTDGSDILTEYHVDLGNGRVVCLRGLTSDLQAITTSSWLQTKTHIDGYLEAAAKLTVYLVAALSGNLTQVGSIILLVLLILTAGLLGLSNANAKTFSMYGRLAAPTTINLPAQ
ncbi:hypothetical protein GGR57DRAFT_518751 [Xylariaceae sp. FL1272]|nr:hypothetical protein GGR57DRAFT_518751 [Xylariaceae sp. FL1272]